MVLADLLNGIPLDWLPNQGEAYAVCKTQPKNLRNYKFRIALHGEFIVVVYVDQEATLHWNAVSAKHIQRIEWLTENGLVQEIELFDDKTKLSERLETLQHGAYGRTGVHEIPGDKVWLRRRFTTDTTELLDLNYKFA